MTREQEDMIIARAQDILERRMAVQRRRDIRLPSSSTAGASIGIQRVPSLSTFMERLTWGKTRIKNPS